ncbi:MAG: tetratricopeptide repeat protein, partial [Chitinispirillales bacterium]|nr:tetratricopeptide repeat protein [Chitinispirillales bacterium]
PRGAIACLNRGLDANPGNANLLFRIGGLYLATSQYEQAINMYQASLGRKVSESNVEALRIIGEIYYTKLMNEKKAREYFKKYVRASGKNSDADAFMKKLTMR